MAFNERFLEIRREARRQAIQQATAGMNKVQLIQYLQNEARTGGLFGLQIAVHNLPEAARMILRGELDDEQ